MTLETQRKVKRIFKSHFGGNGGNWARGEIKKLTGPIQTLLFQKLQRGQARLTAKKMRKARSRETADRCQAV